MPLSGTVGKAPILAFLAILLKQGHVVTKFHDFSEDRKNPQVRPMLTR